MKKQSKIFRFKKAVAHYHRRTAAVGVVRRTPLLERSRMTYGNTTLRDERGPVAIVSACGRVLFNHYPEEFNNGL